VDLLPAFHDLHGVALARFNVKAWSREREHSFCGHATPAAQGG